MSEQKVGCRDEWSGTRRNEWNGAVMTLCLQACVLCLSGGLHDFCE